MREAEENTEAEKLQTEQSMTDPSNSTDTRITPTGRKTRATAESSSSPDSLNTAATLSKNRVGDS